jgi:hypothetical protein
VKHQVLTAAIMKTAVFWVVAPFNLAIALMIEAASTYETPIKFYHTIQRNNPEDKSPHARSRNIFKPHSVKLYKEATLHCVSSFEAFRIKELKRLCFTHSHRPGDGDIKQL